LMKWAKKPAKPVMCPPINKLTFLGDPRSFMVSELFPTTGLPSGEKRGEQYLSRAHDDATAVGTHYPTAPAPQEADDQYEGKSSSRNLCYPHPYGNCFALRNALRNAVDVGANLK
jgi:hypothetical protein